MPRLFLVRHGLSAPDPATPPDSWGLDADGLADIDRLAASGRLPAAAAWYSSPETKALETARRLTDRPVTVVPELAEHRRGVHWFADPGDFRAAVRRAFAQPERPAVAEWEPLTALRDRLLPAVRRILDVHPDTDVVLAGHGTAWTLLVSELTGDAPDLDAWAALRMPDLWVVARPEHAVVAVPPDDRQHLEGHLRVPEPLTQVVQVTELGSDGARVGDWTSHV